MDISKKLNIFIINRFHATNTAFYKNHCDVGSAFNIYTESTHLCKLCGYDNCPSYAEL